METLYITAHHSNPAYKISENIYKIIAYCTRFLTRSWTTSTSFLLFLSQLLWSSSKQNKSQLIFLLNAWGNFSFPWLLSLVLWQETWFDSVTYLLLLVNLDSTKISESPLDFSERPWFCLTHWKFQLKR